MPTHPAPRLHEFATPADAPELAALHTAAAARLVELHGTGHWASATSERGVLSTLRHARVLVRRRRGAIIAAATLATKKPWAIDVAWFTPVSRAIYLTGMAVAPGHQGKGIGRALLAAALVAARDWPAGAIRLDAYDAAAGAGAFYAKCGYTERGRVTYRGTPLVYYEQLT